MGKVSPGACILTPGGLGSAHILWEEGNVKKPCCLNVCLNIRGPSYSPGPFQPTGELLHTELLSPPPVFTWVSEFCPTPGSYPAEPSIIHSDSHPYTPGSLPNCVPRALLDTASDEMRGMVFAQGAHGPLGGKGLKARATCPPRRHGGRESFWGKIMVGRGVTSYRINRHVPGVDNTHRQRHRKENSEGWGADVWLRAGS